MKDHQRIQQLQIAQQWIGPRHVAAQRAMGTNVGQQLQGNVVGLKPRRRECDQGTERVGTHQCVHDVSIGSLEGFWNIHG